MKKTALLLITLIPITTSATVFGGSNLGYAGYPGFTDIAPIPPYIDDQLSWDRYRRDVADYTDRAKQYLDDANNDIKRIQEAQQDAIQRANDVVEEYNRKINGY